METALDQWKIRKAVFGEDPSLVMTLDAIIAAHPIAVSASSLIFNYAGSAAKRSPVTEFVAFIWKIHRINDLIWPLGYSIERDGGTPQNKYWIQKI